MYKIELVFQESPEIKMSITKGQEIQNLKKECIEIWEELGGRQALKGSKRWRFFEASTVQKEILVSK